MSETIEIEKHRNGTQIYIDDKAYAWIKKGEKLPASLDRYIGAETIETKANYLTRHFRIRWDCSRSEWFSFLEQLSAVTVSGEYFRASIGEVYLSVCGVQSSRDEIKTIEDVMHRWRKTIIVEKYLSHKPQPQKFWHGTWIGINQILGEK